MPVRRNEPFMAVVVASDIRVRHLPPTRPTTFLYFSHCLFINEVVLLLRASPVWDVLFEYVLFSMCRTFFFLGLVPNFSNWGFENCSRAPPPQKKILFSEDKNIYP